MKSILVFLALTLLQNNAHAWGNLGHRVTGAVAERHLCEKAKLQALTILEGESLAEASTWADDQRSTPGHSHWGPWHYVNITIGKTYQDSEKETRGDVVTSIAAQIQILKTSTVMAERRQALRLLIHFVGDAHQPFHAGTSDDHGANSLMVDWFGREQNLHWIWDTGLIDKINLSFSEVTKFIDAPLKPHTPFAQLTPTDWVNESARLTIDAYPKIVPPKAGFSYYDIHIETVKRRLREAGVRLAEIINQELGC